MESLPCTPQQTLSHELRTLINQRNMLTANSKAKVLNALDKEIQEENMKRQMYVINEIFTSEESYLNQLEILMKYFKEPLDSSDMMPAKAKHTLFGNIESIYKVHGELINQLRLHGNNVGQAFVNLAPYLKHYKMYSYCYTSARKMLEELMKQKNHVSTWIKSQETRPEVNNKLIALLIAPIQRLPRYRLLLRRLLSLTPNEDPHHETLTYAVKGVEEIIRSISFVVFDQEKTARLHCLQQCLVNKTPIIIAPHKKLIKEGVLSKVSSSGRLAHQRYFMLLTDSVLCCKILRPISNGSKPMEPGSLKCSAELPISKCSVESVLGSGMLKLTCRSDMYILFTENKEESRAWVAEIRRAITLHQDNMKTLKKTSSSCITLPVKKRKRILKENQDCNNEEGNRAKKAKLNDQNDMQEQTPQPNKIIKSVKSVIRTIGENVHSYLHPRSGSK